jgi:SSS family solute:Na+ symporter
MLFAQLHLSRSWLAQPFLAQAQTGIGGINPIDLTVLCAYVLGIALVAVIVSRKAKTTEGFTVGSRNMPGWAIGMSILGTYISSISFLALPGKAFDTNWSYFVFTLTLPVAALIAVVFFLPIYRREGLVSAYEFLEERLGYGGRAYAAACFVLLQVVRSGVILYLVAIALEPMADWKLWHLVLATGAFVTLYCMIGGFEAVIWTDVVQVFVLIGGALLCLGQLYFFEIEGGVSAAMSSASDAGKFSLTPADWSIEPQESDYRPFGKPIMMATILTVVIYGVFENIKNFGVDQNYIQRFVAAKSTREAGRSLWLGSLMYIPLSLIFFLIGTGLFVLYKHADTPTAVTGAPVASQTIEANANLLPEDIQKGDKVFPYFIQKRLPVGLRGLLVAAVFAAAMSTVSTSLNSASTVCMQDFYKRKIRPDATDDESLRMVRWFTLIFGIVGTLAGIGVILFKAEAAIDIWWIIAGILGGPFLGLFLLAVLVRRLGGMSVLISAIAGVLMIAWVMLSRIDAMWPDSLNHCACKWDGLMAGPVGTLTMVVVGLILAGFRATEPKPAAIAP